MSEKRREPVRTASYDRHADSIRARRAEKAKRAAEKKWWRDRRLKTRAWLRLGKWAKPAKGSKGTKRKRRRIRDRLTKRMSQ